MIYLWRIHPKLYTYCTYALRRYQRGEDVLSYEAEALCQYGISAQRDAADAHLSRGSA